MRIAAKFILVVFLVGSSADLPGQQTADSVNALRIAMNAANEPFGHPIQIPQSVISAALAPVALAEPGLDQAGVNVPQPPWLIDVVQQSPNRGTRESAAKPVRFSFASSPQIPSEPVVPAPWWIDLVKQPLDGREQLPVDPETLIQQALLNAPAIMAISQNPLIQETEINVANARFDVDMFLKTQFDDRVDPVGNLLTTGGLPFLEDHIWYSDGGIRRKLYSGGNIELRQRLGFQNSNSRFFDPQDQGTATLLLNFSQPLMRGRGQCYNRSQIMIAEVGTQIAWDKLSGELELELTTLVEAYWNLFNSRAVLLQKRQNVERGQVILMKLEGRSSLDSLPSQIARARAAVSARETELAVAQRDVLNAETVIRRILGSQDAFHADAPELVPTEGPVLMPNQIQLESVITEAMQQRSEVKQSLQRARVAAIQYDIGLNDMRPELNMIFNSYVAALRGDSDIPGAWGDQFQNSTPGFAAGFEFNMPYGRRAARARLSRQQLVVEQVRHEIDLAIHLVIADAQTSWRRVDSAYQTTMAASVAVDAARADLLQNEARWESFALIEGDLAEGQTPTTLLDQLLDAQQRLANAELTWSQAMMEFKIAEINLKRSMGTLLVYYQQPVDADNR